MEVTALVLYKRTDNLIWRRFYIKDTGFVKRWSCNKNRLVDSVKIFLVIKKKAWDNGWTCEGSQLSKTTFENLDL